MSTDKRPGRPPWKPDVELERLVIDCLVQRLTEAESLRYINKEQKKLHKKTIATRTLRKIKKYLREHELERLYEIANQGFVSQHFNRIDDLEMIKKKMWEYAKKLEKQDVFKAAQVLVWLTAIQPYLSQYYEASKFIMQKVAMEHKRDASETSAKSESDYIPIPPS